ncbi:MAG: NAD(P)/FAD-dependent oxidoreductase [Syntrophaceae bacterium]
MKAVVIGAGIAGLTAVHTLKKAGVDVVCFERDDVPGGRVVSARRDGFIMDVGAQFFFKNYQTCYALADELGIGNQKSQWTFRVGFPDRGGWRPVVATTNPREIVQTFAETMYFLQGTSIPFKARLQAMGVVPTLASRYRDLDFIDFEQALDLDHETLADFVIRKGGRELLEYLFQSVASTMTLEQPEKMSAAYGLGLLVNMIGGLTTFQHGIGTITERLAERNAACIRYGTKVEKIVIEDGKVKGVEVGGALVEADVVIPAITATRLLKMAPGLPETIRQPLEKVTYSACCHVIFALPGPLLPEGWYALSTPRMLKALVSGYTNNAVKSPYYAPSKCTQISCFTYDHYAHALNEQSDEEVKRALIKDLQRFMPHMPDEPLFTEIRRWREAVCLAPTGMLTAMARMKKQHYRDVKGLYLAGEYLNMPSVESAAKSGSVAAQAALSARN